MVSYQTMVSMAFEIVDEEGGSFENIDETGEFLSQLGSLWTENKSRIKQWSESRTRRFLEERISP